MFIIKGLLITAAVVVALYPLWGVLQPMSYLAEILETYPFAKGANEAQIRIASGLLLISNSIMSLSLLFISFYITRPISTHFLKLSALLLISYPLILCVVEVFSSKELSRHLDSPIVTLEFSAIKLLYMVFGIALFGIYKTLKQTEPAKLGSRS
ncbi:hypothetical protein [uncultured Shewanella sp.]|uniref:hypothetical protein n=1 Tax=uncultured Shewanella sp. TaxID=173975 RepID=UPI002610ECC9|nr:hypothetical protein [uncultured Shewanella sp.]